MLSYTLQQAAQWDAQHPLNHLSQAFYIPQVNQKDSIYLCGNSLGLQPKTAQKYLQQDMEDWAKLGVEGHFKGQNPWFHYHKFLTSQSAKLVGALDLEVVVMNQLSVNLQLLLTSFYKPTTSRFKIIMEAGAFPSDMYVIETQLALHGIAYNEGVIELEPAAGEHHLRHEAIMHAIAQAGNELALVFLPGVQYYTGQTFDIESITAAAHAVGALAGWDLAHAAGNIPMQLHQWQVDFASWCSYKYLNSGPGNVSGVFVHQNHFDKNKHRLAGWWGHREDMRFKMLRGYIPEPGAAGWQLSNAPVFGMAVHRASLDMFDEIGMQALSAKSNELTTMLRKLLLEAKDINTALKFEIITPINKVGAQLSLLTDENGKKLFDYLETNGVICDWREPNVIRMAPVPMYNTMHNVVQVAELFLSFSF